MIINETINNALIAPVRSIKARVEFYEDSTLVLACNCNDRLINFNVERIGDMSKFFGFGIVQRLNVHLIDKNRELELSTAISIKVGYSINGQEFVYPYPTFHISEVHRNENTNELSITAYDKLNNIGKYTVADLPLPDAYNLLYFMGTISNIVGTSAITMKGINNSTRLLENFAEGGNFEGTEKLRDAMDDLAEYAQAIYYVDNEDRLVLRRLERDADPVLTIRKADYITLSSKTNRRLTSLCATNDLRSDITASITVSGTTQFLRNNAFYDKLEGAYVGELLDEAIDLIGNLIINQFDCSWRGNFLLEIGDKIGLITKDNELMTSYVLNDTITYTGALMETTSWQYSNSENETATNPTTLGEALNQTFAKVDKVNKQIELVVSEVGTYTESIANIQLKTDQITNSVESVEKEIDGLTLDITTLTNRVSSTMTEEDIRFLIEEEFNDGTAESVITKTGFIFNEEGMTIEKSDSNISTIITEDGMNIKRSGTTALSVNNEGVLAEDLHATTYLLIGENSRFEDYQSNRTGCFWIGIAEEV